VVCIVCDNCGSKIGPFYKAFEPIKGKALRACGPIQYEKETGKLIGRVIECNKRRAQLEDKWYGKQGHELEVFKLEK